ncbi:MAG: PP2C family protein-serine/threonine phosphatase [Ignavibacteriales bacterium]|nr:PP2C family protein-serine/threonine phosphatase [Ignavibacteriales bacterium]
MTTLETDFGGIAAGLLLSSVGLISIVISLFRLRSRDLSLLNFGLFCFLNGIRWLVEIPTMKALVGFPFTVPYFHGLLTYAIVIPFSALLVDLFGRGLYDSMLWVFRSTIVYAVAAVGFDLFRSEPLADVSINAIVIVLWCVVWIGNVVFTRTQQHRELRVLRIVFLTTLVYTAIDNLINIRILLWGVNFEHAVFLVLCIGLGYVAVHHFFSNEKKLLGIEQEIEIARRIQRSNLPGNLRSPSGIEIVARYVAKSTVAGDFYDIQITGESGVGILIADVSGHGIGAALIGSMLKVAFASQAECCSNPSKVLTEINRILHGKMEESFVTACSLFIDVANGRVLYANAGHPPPLLWRSSKKEVFRFPPGGTILGPFPESVYENATVDIARHDRLFLYTDGIIETRSRTGEFFGDVRLEEFVKGHSSDSANSVADMFIEHLGTWSGRSQESTLDDDLTLIVIDVLAEPDASKLGTSRKDAC